MRGLLMVVAVLMLAGCGEGAADKPAKVQATTVAQVSAPQWDVLVEDPKAISDLTDRLVEHGFPSFVAVRDGKERVLLGPFNSRAAAEEKRAQLALKMSYQSSIVDHTL
ncbi:SPOR domain-containing protein [Pseudomonas sp. 10B1]|uniref:SPOR domain-containing protein n=1 Tax=unclassified Pseudomonas TaxID=196821 RepID=UPI002AB4D87E|nr:MULTISPECIES: SPOR domain-containing protein [unclassified Pseudomonas]MDY7560598.1 SPOR domain-containing protein [Pseudomonas sp. AB6]MEA9975808.1 SPOR domain-containing protein [Pseudomonas sp. RTS4]MEA9993354.1 SPOR domain-containing protein [Pseudomonas sp. AA4]MEB0088456.1 SPOR domain-containing protein [Pseudomonas sp. RTI1]MEB0124159.1 SPOR domain-containing protein [Pseudomonas sp. CCC1.2]